MGRGVIPRSPEASEEIRREHPTLFEHIQNNPEWLAFFTTLRGCSQGDPTSPSNWTAFFDILLRALIQVEATPSFFHPSHGVAAPGSDSAYADDLATLSRTKEGLQIKMDIVSAFASIFGLTINIKKLCLLSNTAWPQQVFTYKANYVGKSNPTMDPYIGHHLSHGIGSIPRPRNRHRWQRYHTT